MLENKRQGSEVESRPARMRMKNYVIRILTTEMALVNC